MPKFVTPTIHNNFINGKENGLGSVIAFEFMAAQLMIAAQGGGYEVYSMLYDTLEKDNFGVCRAV